MSGQEVAQRTLSPGGPPINNAHYEGVAITPRIWARIVKNQEPDGCWVWTGLLDTGGYGIVRASGHMVKVHRLVYFALVGSTILTIDHLCRNKACCNPEHLEAVPHAENIRRGDAGKHLRDRTHCPAGHPYAGEGSSVYVGPHGRACRHCNNAACARYRQRRRERAA